MASLRYEDDRGRRGWRLQFRDTEKRKRSIWLGDVPESSAQETKEHVEHLLDRANKKRPPAPVTSDWLASIGDGLRNKLAHCGLAEPAAKLASRELTLGEWIDEYITEREDVKSATRETYTKAKVNLLNYFGRKKLLRDISPTDAKKWRIWLKTRGNRRDSHRSSMADETVRRRTGTVKQFFREAVERGYLTANPFEKLPSTTQGNEKRQFFVAPDVIERCMDHCPCDDWKTILALSRFGGLRCPSELVALRWTDVDLPGRKMMIHASKTAHHATGGVRVCPIFPELRPYLEAAWDAAPEGADFVIGRYRKSTQNLRQTFLKILKRTGITPWPRLFQNLRASRETELMARYPAKDVASWLGNSEPVAMRHYAMATDESFQAASDPNGQTVTRHVQPATPVIGGSIPGLPGVISGTAGGTANSILAGDSRVFIVQDSVGGYWLMGDEGLEPPTSSV